MADQARERADTVVDADDATFGSAVIDRSYEVPVVVDFWADWCGPCRVLGPVLERLAEEADGAWQLVKVDVERSPALSMRYGIQSIPAVIAFVDGQAVDAFTGALPERQVRAFVDALVPSEADRLTEEARLAEASDDWLAAEAGYRAALAGAPEHPGALYGLGRVLHHRGAYDEARQVLERVPYGAAEREGAESLAARVRFQADNPVTIDETEVRRRIATNPDDLDARLALATHLAGREAYRDALEALLEVMRRNRDAFHDRAHEEMLAVFKALGDDHPLTREYRPHLAALLW